MDKQLLVGVHGVVDHLPTWLASECEVPGRGEAESVSSQDAGGAMDWKKRERG